MYSLIGLVCCIGIAAASQCCVPPQWETSGSFLTTVVYHGKPYVSRGMVSMAYDAVRRRIGQIERIMIGDQVEQRVGVLMDFNTNTKYVINEAGKCYMEELGRSVGDFAGCIPDNATLVGDHDLVGFGNNDMNVNTYLMQYEGVTSYVTLTSEGCIPVVETIRGTLDGSAFLQNNHYFNLTAGISSPETLNVPPTGCENAAMFKHSFMNAGVNSPIGKRSFFGF